MKILTAYCTDKGNIKSVNQDALLIKTAHAGELPVTMLGVCDGMGGLAMGERASAHLIHRFSEWFAWKLPQILEKERWTEDIREQWVQLIETANEKLASFGAGQGVSLGTTCTVFLMLGEIYYLIHVGDSRVYEITDEIRQITDDQTVLAREIAMGRVDPARAEEDARGSVLLQCVGASSQIDPQFLQGKIRENAVYLLCSDGFRHKISAEEMRQGFSPEAMTDEMVMERKCSYFTELIKDREERDNITVVLAKVQKD